MAVAVGAGVGFAGLWIVLAAVRPGVTFHLAPIIVVAAVPVTHRIGSGRPAAPLAMAATVGLGAALGLATLALLEAAGGLQGPPLDLFSSVAIESLLGLAVGVVVGSSAEMWPARLDG